MFHGKEHVSLLVFPVPQSQLYEPRFWNFLGPQKFFKIVVLEWGAQNHITGHCSCLGIQMVLGAPNFNNPQNPIILYNFKKPTHIASLNHVPDISLDLNKMNDTKNWVGPCFTLENQWFRGVPQFQEPPIQPTFQWSTIKSMGPFNPMKNRRSHEK